MITEIQPETNLVEILSSPSIDNEELIDRGIMVIAELSNILPTPQRHNEIFDILIDTVKHATLNTEIHKYINNDDIEVRTLRAILLFEINLRRFGERTENGFELPRYLR